MTLRTNAARRQALSRALREFLQPGGFYKGPTTGGSGAGPAIAAAALGVGVAGGQAHHQLAPAPDRHDQHPPSRPLIIILRDILNEIGVEYGPGSAILTGIAAALAEVLAEWDRAEADMEAQEGEPRAGGAGPSVN